MPTPHIDHLVIFGLTPEFLGRPVLWYAEQEKKLRTSPLENPFLREHVLVLQRDSRAILPEFLRRLDDLGYEKVLSVGRFGEFAHRGGIIDVFPINTERPFRIEFSGNRIEAIEALPVESDLNRKDWEKITRRTIAAPLSSLHAGDFLVHLDHGIGIFLGKTTLTVDAETRSYLILEYGKGDKLYAPEEVAQRKISRYIGFGKPTVHRLGTAAWLVTKRRVREDAKRFAEELLKLYAERSLAQRTPYRTHDTILESFVSSFPFEPTADQTRAWKDVLRDLGAPHPMDRLLAGDVGFGKTELALRATVVVAINNGQTALLSPTTVLADQHFRTSRKRLENLGLRSALLTRLQTKSEQRRILSDLKEGKIDILIGTHRLLSKDVAFKNLKLLIIDEEQRFGVRQKEALKRFRGALDVLSLSATPIPRTLAQSLTDIHPVSRLQVAPQGRTEIETFFAKWDWALVREALHREHRRGGQSYILHNRIATIASFTKELRARMPKLRFGIVHGRLSEISLVDIMQKLRHGELDALVATTIIENGIDLANVNTLIVEDATRLGLAQAYQLRGRIGRGARQAYAYFCWPENRQPTGKAQERLDALHDASELGSGWQLALRDLEIRGAGNLLGREQSGLVNRVGFNLYAQLLAEAVETLRAQTKEKIRDP